MKEIPLIEVLIWGKRVGAVAMDPKAGCYAFEYADRWKRDGVELAPLTMPLARASGPFLFPSLAKETYKGLPGLLADCLPDDFGNALIDAWMARKGVKKDAVTTLNLSLIHI
jgi:serine/threonine-protein kinase HipA